MFKKLFDFLRRKSVKEKRIEKNEAPTNIQDEKEASSERKEILEKAKPLLIETKNFCDSVLDGKSHKKVLWGQMYYKAKEYRREINTEFPSIFENDVVSAKDLIKVHTGTNESFVYDAVESWNREKLRFMQNYDKILASKDLNNFTYALYVACKSEIEVLRNMVEKVLAEIE